MLHFNAIHYNIIALKVVHTSISNIYIYHIIYTFTSEFFYLHSYIISMIYNNKIIHIVAKMAKKKKNGKNIPKHCFNPY